MRSGARAPLRGRLEALPVSAAIRRGIALGAAGLGFVAHPLDELAGGVAHVLDGVLGVALGLLEPCPRPRAPCRP